MGVRRNVQLSCLKAGQARGQSQVHASVGVSAPRPKPFRTSSIMESVQLQMYGPKSALRYESSHQFQLILTVMIALVSIVG